MLAATNKINKSVLLVLTLFVTFYTACKVQVKNEERVVLEGYYMRGWESQAFYPLDRGKVYKPYWLSSHPDYPINDSLWDIVYLHSNYEGIYLQVEGILKSEGGYGHMGGAEKEIVVIRILRFDLQDCPSKITNLTLPFTIIPLIFQIVALRLQLSNIKYDTQIQIPFFRFYAWISFPLGDIPGDKHPPGDVRPKRGEWPGTRSCSGYHHGPGSDLDRRWGTKNKSACSYYPNRKHYR